MVTKAFRETSRLAACWLCAALALGCGDDAPPTTDGGPSLCMSDAECDDGVFCNGSEICDPEAADADASGCAPAPDPCMAGRTCDEEADMCLTACDADADADGDGVDAMECGGDDCDDGDAARYPGNTEVCDAENVDEDCDPSTFGEIDADFDGAFDATCCNEDSSGNLICGDDCDDGKRRVRPLAAEVCDELDNDCDGDVDEDATFEGFEDSDHDLHGDPDSPIIACPRARDVATVSNDCDDSDPAAHGAQVEICDGIDNDCDGNVDEDTFTVTWYADDDGDGWGSPDGGTTIACAQPEGYVLYPFDCDDSDAAINPDAEELCNGIDDDCNGVADFRIGMGDYEDDDEDGVADASCGGDDCNDEDPYVQPGFTELCDEVDNDCDGTVDEDTSEVDWYEDDDGDLAGASGTTATSSCERIVGSAIGDADCDDGDATTRPGAIDDDCDGNDDDCDGSVDEDAITPAVYVDDDEDGFGTGEPVLACAVETGFSEIPGDCNDTDETVNPGAAESCNEVDDDCDSSTDEGVLTTFYEDGDGDDYGALGGATMMACTAPSGFGTMMGDCNDIAPAIYPGATELCNDLDDDCDTTTDEDAAASCTLDGVDTASCIAGTCIVDTCTSGYGNCDIDDSNGCETDFSSDPTNCGGCGTLCGVAAGCISEVCETGLTEVVAGKDYSCVLRDNAAVACWGSSAQPGTGSFGALTPVEITGIEDASVLWGGLYTICSDEVSTGGVQCWGDGQDVVIDPPVVTAEVIAYYDGHACALQSSGLVGCWGNGGYGQLGDGNNSFSATPVAPTGLGTSADVATGYRHSCAVKTDGTVWCWGANNWNMLGRSGGASGVPVQATGFDDPTSNPIMTIDTHSTHSCALDSMGQVWCWGASSVSQTGIDSFAALPHRVGDGSGGFLTGMAEVEVGAGFSCARSGVGSVLCWGETTDGRLGNGVSTPGGERAAPQVVLRADDSPLSSVADIAVGETHACALTTTNEVWCWGNNQVGMVGDGTNLTDRPKAVQVLNLP